MISQQERYQQVAEANARDVIRRYSTSFGVASSLLDRQTRQHIVNVYGLVRLADEVVDGVAAAYGLDTAQVRTALDALEVETIAAMTSGYSTNLIVHAFAGTARSCGIGVDEVKPFFASMRMDTEQSQHDAATFSTYVYGSAEVVGLMCLRTFTVNTAMTDAERDAFVSGARALGSAFQKVNFLRDIAADVDGLGRHYFPSVDFTQFSDAQKRELVADIDAELDTAGQLIPLLPRGSRRAVWLASALFRALNRKIDRTPATRLANERLSVSTAHKIWLYMRARWGGIR